MNPVELKIEMRNMPPLHCGVKWAVWRKEKTMWEKTTKQYFVESLYTQDVVTASGGITFEGRYTHHVLSLRHGKIAGKIVSDMWGIKDTEYYKPT